MEQDHQLGENGLFENENSLQSLYGNYIAYCELKAINYSDEEIAKQFYCSIDDLEVMKSTFE